MIKRRLTFPAKAELFHGRGFRPAGARLVPQEGRPAADGPLGRPGQRVSSMDGVIRSCCGAAICSVSIRRAPARPDGRLYKGKTGVARLVLQAGVPVIPVGMIDTELVPSLLRIPIMRRPGIRSARRWTSVATPGRQRPRRAALDHRRDHGRRDGAVGQDHVDMYGYVEAALERAGSP